MTVIQKQKLKTIWTQKLSIQSLMREFSVKCTFQTTTENKLKSEITAPHLPAALFLISKCKQKLCWEFLIFLKTICFHKEIILNLMKNFLFLHNWQLFQMGSRSPQNIWGSSSRCHRLSDGLHSVPSSLSIWQGQMTEYTLPTTKSINKTMSETNFMDTRFARKYSYVSTDWLIKL